MAVLIVLAVGGAGYLLFFTSVLAVRAVEVSGHSRVDADTVIDRAAVPDGQPMLRVDTAEVEDHVAELSEIETVDVARSWRLTVDIEVVEREPVAYVDAVDGIRLVDEHGVAFHGVTSPPDDLPAVEVETVSTDDPETRATMSVLTGLPEDLRDSVRVVAANSPGNVELTLADGATVRWGDADQMARKAKVLDALLTQPGDTYDVSSPELPTVS